MVKFFLDALSVFTGLCPFLLLDGHGSHFKLAYFTYIHQKETKWDVGRIMLDKMYVIYIKQESVQKDMTVG